MRFYIFILLLLIPSLSFSQDANQEARPPSLFEQALRISCQIDHQNPEVKKFENEMNRIREIGYRIVGQTSDARPFTFNFIDDPAVNAFALPGGFIFITKGMIKLKLTDDEWAQLLGHELTHIIKNHHTKGQASQTAVGLFSLIAANLLLAVAINEANQNNKNQYTEDSQKTRQKEIQNMITTTYIGSSVLNYLYALKYSRELEREADFYGRKFAAAAGYDPNASESLFNKLSKSDNHHIDNMWRSHPQMLDRAYAASLSIEKRIEKDFEPDTKIAKENAQAALLQYAEYYSSKELASIPKKPVNNLRKVAYYHYLIFYLSKLVMEIDKTSPYAKKALQAAFEQSLILKAFGNETPNWGILYHLYQELDPTSKNCEILEPLATNLYNELTESFNHNRAGIPTLLSLTRNFPNHPQSFSLYLGLLKAYFQNREYDDIPDKFLKASRLVKTNEEKTDLAKFGKKFIRVSKYPYQLFKMVRNLDDQDFTDAANKAYLKIIEKCESLSEVAQILEEESLSEFLVDKNTIKEEAIKKTFNKAKLKEDQQLKTEASQYYNEILIYGGSSPYVALAESALKSLGYE